jgi:hypothetical protein
MELARRQQKAKSDRKVSFGLDQTPEVSTYLLIKDYIMTH